MKRILLVLAILAGSVFMAAPATAADDPAAGDPAAVTSTETPETTTPETTTPETTTPETTTPETTTPETTTPEEQQVAPTQKLAAASVDDEAIQPLAAAARGPLPKVTICHARAAFNNPYGPKAQSVNQNSIVKPNGHATHTGPVFDGVNSGWGDIIPPFPGFDGLNWTTEGQAIYNNNCQPADVQLTTVTATEPVLDPPTCEMNGLLTLPEIEGVIYTADPAFDGSTNEPGKYIVTAIADEGFVLSPGSFTQGTFNVKAQRTGPRCQTITICHRTNSNKNPYNEISPSIKGVFNGHDKKHDGPIWNPTLKAQHIKWGDIIPPYTYQGVDYPGQNWDLQGQLIYRAGCVPVDLPEVDLTSPTFVLTDRCTGDVVDENTDDPTRIVPVAGDGGYTWEFATGDGQNGAWDLVFTPKDGFEFAPDAVHEVTGDAGTAADCAAPEAGVLPDTGGSSPWILLMGVGLTVGGVLLLSARAALGLAGSSPIGAPSMTWTQEVLTTRELKSHRGQRRRQGWLWILTGKRS